jgi:hypothetical protein
MPMEPEVRENKDETNSTISEEVQVDTVLEVPSLSDNLRLTVTELKLSLQELLDLFSQTKKSLQTFIE